ncbi:Abi family protein [Cyclobacterium marinum]|uniref:Abi family protein n=1 Tax=Cyclobacterium marinum (strain ATCC 25205 / DSM 745 / LMG 13164 / NCIMB 1802) TaxID=880070 RepID=G0J0N2_CYCMS|nr:Abi family protein [Cyclobacterium marinum]AEL24444.1 Abi family protein [Cyclobacterium marinum DSM 745]
MFDKRPTTINEQIEILKSRGLKIESESEASHYLSHISYYRLGEYWHSMQEDKERHIFKATSKFSDVIALYCFDRELRSLLFDVIEKLEISLRTKLIYHLSHEFDPWWFQNFEIFTDSRALVKTLSGLEEEISRSKDPILKNHFKKHKDDKRFPPAWKTLEQTSFGALSKLYGNLKNTIKSKNTIAEEYGTVNHTFLPSWLQSIAQIRNYCAHHSRLWNKNLPGAPKLLSNPPYAWVQDVPKQHEFLKLYVHLCLMKYLLNVVAPGNHFTKKLIHLFEKYPNVDPNALGMKLNWSEEDLWKTYSSNKSD